MSLVEWAKKNSRALGKVGLYGAGGVLLGYPVVKFGLGLWRGQTVEGAICDGVYEGSGYNTITGNLNQTKTRDVVIRDLIGAGCIFAAKKI